MSCPRPILECKRNPQSDGECLPSSSYAANHKDLCGIHGRITIVTRLHGNQESYSASLLSCNYPSTEFLLYAFRPLEIAIARHRSNVRLVILMEFSRLHFLAFFSAKRYFIFPRQRFK